MVFITFLCFLSIQESFFTQKYDFSLVLPLDKSEMSKKAIQTRWEWSNEVKPALKWLVLVPQWWKIAFEPTHIPFQAFIWQKTRFYPLIWDKRRYPGLFPPDADFGNTFFMIPNVCGINPEKRQFGTLSKIKWHFPLSCQNLWTRPLLIIWIAAGRILVGCK